MNSAFDPASPFLGNFAKIMKKLMKLIFFYCGTICNYTKIVINYWK